MTSEGHSMVAATCALASIIMPGKATTMTATSQAHSDLLSIVVAV